MRHYAGQAIYSDKLIWIIIYMNNNLMDPHKLVLFKGFLAEGLLAGGETQVTSVGDY